MALVNKINKKAPTDENTGFGTISALYGGRLFRKDGTPNVRKTGISWMEQQSWYHTMLQMSRWKFLAIIFATYLFINLFFALVYLAVGIEKIAGVAVGSVAEKFSEAFFFSAQTFTTVGYGRLSPTGWLMSFIASSEALIGLLGFAVATGLMYGRFSRPRAFIRFSSCALIAPYKQGIALMLRFAPYKNNHLTEAEVKLTLAMMVEDEGRKINKFFPLKLELDKVNALTLNWTLVHVIDESSPFFGLSEDDLQQANTEILVFIKGFDESFSNTVVARGSYQTSEIVYGGKFVPMYYKDVKRDITVLNMSKLDEYTVQDISETQMMKLRKSPLHQEAVLS